MEKKSAKGATIYPVVKLGDEVLEKKAADVIKFDGELQKLVADMFESMYEAQGVGLAANQIGISKRIAVIDTTCGKDPKAKLVLINPEVIETEGKQFEEEGCLSIPGFRETVQRPSKATIRALDQHGKEYVKTGTGLLARAFCHETDHLNGKFFISHLSTLKRDLIRRKIRKMAKNGEW